MDDYPMLDAMTDLGLVQLLGEYVKNPGMAEADKEFIAAIQSRLKQRSGE